MNKEDKKDIYLKPCPFCGHEPLMELDPHDILYPKAIYWREHPEVGRIYVGRKQYNPETDHPCWNILCQILHGGCGAEMHADSVEEVIAKWNHRV